MKYFDICRHILIYFEILITRGQALDFQSRLFKSTLLHLHKTIVPFLGQDPKQGIPLELDTYDY